MSVRDRIRPILVKASERIETRWKNGRGRAHEIFRIDDEGGWVWRLSLAAVDADGPFSLFPGYDRLLVLTTGQSMRLSFEDGEHRVIERGCPSSFSCDRPVVASLESGPCHDLNLIWRRRDLTGEGHSLCLSGQMTQVVEPASWHICTVSSGNVDVALDGDAPYRLEAGDTVVLHDPGHSLPSRMTFDTRAAELVALRLRPVAR